MYKAVTAVSCTHASRSILSPAQPRANAYTPTCSRLSHKIWAKKSAMLTELVEWDEGKPGMSAFRAWKQATRHTHCDECSSLSSRQRTTCEPVAERTEPYDGRAVWSGRADEVFGEGRDVYSEADDVEQPAVSLAGSRGRKSSPSATYRAAKEEEDGKQRDEEGMRWAISPTLLQRSGPLRSCCLAPVRATHSQISSSSRSTYPSLSSAHPSATPPSYPSHPSVS